MGLFFQTSCADVAGTLLENHTPTVLGAPFLKHGSYSTGSIHITAGNRLAATPNNVTAVYYTPEDPVGREYAAICDLTAVTEAKEAGLCCRTSSSVDTHYLAWYNYEAAGGAKWQLFSVIAGSITQLAVQASTFPGTGSPKTLKFRFHCFDGSKALSYSLDGGGTWTEVLSSTDNSITSKGFLGIRMVGTAVDGADLQISNIQGSGSAATFSLAPHYLVANSGNNSVVLTGANTTWTPGTPGTPTFILSGGVNASLVTQTIGGANAATLSINPGSAPGTLVVTDPTGGTSKTLLVLQGLPVSGAAFRDGLSPYNWHPAPASGFVRTNCLGAYGKFCFTGTRLVLCCDSSDLLNSGAPASNLGKLRFTIDGGAYQDIQLPGTPKNLLAASGLAAGVHTVEFKYVQRANLYDLWNGPLESLKLTGIGLDAGAVLAPASGAVAIRRYNILALADSIGAGNNSRATGANQLTAGDAGTAIPSLLGPALSGEVGVVAYPGQGLTVAGSDNVPSVANAYSLYYKNYSRLTNGVLTPSPDFIVVLHGTNDRNGSDGDVTTATTTLIGNLRTIAPTGWIVICAPPGRWKAAALEAGVLAAGDARAVFVDPGPMVAVGLDNTGAKVSTVDGLHPTEFWHALSAAVYVNRIAAATLESDASGSGTGGVSRSRIFGGF